MPQVVPLMPVVSLNTAGSRPLKSAAELRGQGEDAVVHHDSKIDKFNKRLQIVRKQRQAGDLSVAEEEVRDVSLFEFWWKFYVDRGRVKRSRGGVCIMVTPSYSADAANVEHAHHEGYARAMVIAHWRHMTTARRRELIRRQTEVRAVPDVCIGGTPFVEPSVVAGPNASQSERFLGVQDLWRRSVGLQGAAT